MKFKMAFYLRTSVSVLLVLFFFIFLPFSTSAQSKPFFISGKLIDAESKEPLEYASVVLYKLPDTVLVSGVVTNTKGEFILNNLVKGKYLIKTNFIGYKNLTKQVEIANQSLNLQEPMMMKASSIEMGTVIVTGSKSEKQQSIEKKTINVSKNIASATGNILDIIKSQAGVSIDNEDNIYIRGNKNTLILMDGVPTTLTSLNSIPTTNVENIEIITNPDVKYDAEGTGGIINIVSKRNREGGLSGNLMVNYDLNESVNGGVNLHYNQGIWNFDFGYNMKSDKYKIESTLDRLLYATDVFVDQEMLSHQTNKSHTGMFMLSAKPTKKDIYTFGIKTVFPQLNNNQTIRGTQTGKDEISNHFNRLNDINWNRRMFEGTFSYKHFFERNKQELSFDASFSRNKGRRPAEYYIENQLLQQSTGGGRPTNLTAQTDYMKNTSKNGKIELGLKGLYKYNDFDYKFYNLDSENGNWILDQKFSNDLEYREYIYSAYLMYSDSLTRNLDYKIGGRMEYNTSELKQLSSNEIIDHEYWFPFPFLQLGYKISNTQSVALSVNRRITRPAYPQINPFISVIDQTTYETGNKKLVPEIVDKIEAGYSLTTNKIILRSNLFFNITKDFITQVSDLTADEKLMLTYVNGKHQYTTGADFDISYKLSKYISFNPAFSAFTTKSEGMYNEIDLHTSDFAWTGSLKTTIKPETKTEIQFFFNYNSPIELPQFKLGRIYYADISAKRSFLKNKLSLILTVTDIFNTNKWNIESNNAVYRLNNYSKNETRRIWIGVSLNFNSYKPVKSQKNNDGEKDNSIIKLGN